MLEAQGISWKLLLTTAADLCPGHGARAASHSYNTPLAIGDGRWQAGPHHHDDAGGHPEHGRDERDLGGVPGLVGLGHGRDGFAEAGAQNALDQQLRNCVASGFT